MHHKLDIHQIPEEMLYVNAPSLAVKVPYETEDEMEKAVTGKKKLWFPYDEVEELRDVFWLWMD